MVYTEDENHKAIAQALYDGVGYEGFVEAHKKASKLSSTLHIKYLDKPKKRVVQQLPLMYDEIWTAGKGSYKLQKPGVLAEDAEIIILAPHIHCFHSNTTLDSEIRQIGYHGVDYVLDFCKKNPTFNRNVASHVINVRSFGTFENGIEKFPFRFGEFTSGCTWGLDHIFKYFNTQEPTLFQWSSTRVCIHR
jgi:nickel-dependent lactate racemase